MCGDVIIVMLILFLRGLSRSSMASVHWTDSPNHFKRHPIGSWTTASRLCRTFSLVESWGLGPSQRRRHGLELLRDAERERLALQDLEGCTGRNSTESNRKVSLSRLSSCCCFCSLMSYHLISIFQVVFSFDNILLREHWPIRQ